MQASLRFSKSGVTVMRLAEMRPADANLESHKVRLPLETRAMSTERPQALVSGAHICRQMCPCSILRAVTEL